MKTHKSYHLGYDVQKVLAAVEAICKKGGRCCYDCETDLLELKDELSSFSETYQDLYTLRKFLMHDERAPQGSFTKQFAYHDILDHRDDIREFMEPYIARYQQTRMEFKVHTASIQTWFGMFDVGEDDEFHKAEFNINPRKWYRTSDTVDIAEAAALSLNNAYCYPKDKLLEIIGQFNDSIDGLDEIVHAVICTDRQQFDGSPFIFPLSVHLKHDGGNRVNAWFVDKKGGRTAIPPTWKIYAYKRYHNG